MVSRSDADSLVEFRPNFPLRLQRLARGYFELRSSGRSATRLTAVVELGWQLPILGAFLDRLIAQIIDLEALRAHIRDEAAYLSSAAGPLEPPTDPDQHQAPCGSHLTGV